MYKSEEKYTGIMLSKRAHVIYLEHAKVILKNGIVTYLKKDSAEGGYGFNIPDKNTAFILLGKGTSITDGAVRKLADSNVVIGFCGSGGSPLTMCTDITFFNSNTVYGPTKYMQSYIKAWVDEVQRFKMAQQLLLMRADVTKYAWDNNAELVKLGVNFNECEKFKSNIEKAKTVQELMGYEGELTKRFYHKLAKAYKVDNFVREHEIKDDTILKKYNVNLYLNYGNSLAYGYTAVVLNGLGINHGLPLLHGLTRRESLVFDIADIVKDGYMMPLAFANANSKVNTQQHRVSITDMCYKVKLLDTMFELVEKLVL
jgi:CRISPR-associated protein Cas1